MRNYSNKLREQHKLTRRKSYSIRNFSLFLLSLLVVGCGSSEPVSEERYDQNDRLVKRLRENLAESADLSQIAVIDHSRLGQQAGSVMPPATALIFSDPQLETELIQLNPLVALDLPLRVLAFEDADSGAYKVTYNSFDYLTARYELAAGDSKSLGEKYDQRLRQVTSGISPEAMVSFASDEMQPDGIITIESPFDFAETIKRVNAAINAQDDTMQFGTVDFQANALDLDIEIAPSYMVLFGGPGPGGKAMSEAPTLGLDGFCQKFLIWKDSSGRVYLSFNDLLALADRQGVKKSLALRVINFRLSKVFGDALSAEQS